MNHPRTKTNAFKRGYSQSSRPFNRHFANKNSIINTNVNTVRVKHTTARDREVVSENRGKGANAGNQQQKEYKEKGVIDSGCSRHMTGNKCYLDEFNILMEDLIKMEFSMARTPQQNGVKSERKNKTLIYASRTMIVPDTSFTKFHKDHPEDQVIGSLKTPVQTRHMTKINEEHGLISYSLQSIEKPNHKDFQNCLFAYFLSQMEPKKPVQALKDPSWVEAMQDELLQFKLLKVWSLKVILKRKSKDYAMKSFATKCILSRGKRKEEEVYVCQPPGFEDPHFPDKVYKVEKALYGLHQAPRAWYETLSTYLLDNGFHRGQIDKTLFIKRHKDDIQLYILNEFYGELLLFGDFMIVKQKSDRIFISQDKYVAEILKKFNFASVKTASTTPNGDNIAIASRPDIMFAVCACARFQVTPKTSHFNAVKRIFRYLKGQPKLGLWYPRDSPFNLEAFSDSDYARASLDRKST
ncbi:putative ribonuclease H-like domain-containing protein [Tanacetum coccineum]